MTRAAQTDGRRRGSGRRRIDKGFIDARRAAKELSNLRRPPTAGGPGATSGNVRWKHCLPRTDFPRWNLGVGYPEQFQLFREARGLTREQLAMRADCHRNTVINLESGRPVKFSTILLLMQHMGFGKDSDEVRLLALMWLESVTGIQIGGPEVNGLQAKMAAHTAMLQGEVTRRHLGRDEIELLTFAARNRKVLNALRAIRELAPEAM